MYRQPVSSRSYCSLDSNGRVDWVNVTTSLAALSLKHPQLLGYRIDDFSESFLLSCLTIVTAALPPCTVFLQISDFYVALNSP